MSKRVVRDYMRYVDFMEKVNGNLAADVDYFSMSKCTLSVNASGKLSICDDGDYTHITIRDMCLDRIEYNGL